MVVFGGYGTFGRLVARALAERGWAITVAGRDAARAGALAAELPPVTSGPHRGIAADATRQAEVRAALDGCAAVASCAGPFSLVGQAILDGSLAAGCHYADLSDDRAFARTVRDAGERFAARGLAAVYGCSSLPAISGALALVAAAASPAPPERARVTLFIGNRNPKGPAAIRSVLGGVGKPFAAPQGTLHGFRDRELVELPPPFGRRAVYNFESPEYDLFPSLLGVASVAVKVGFELKSASLAFALLARLSSRWGERTAALLDGAGRIFAGAGTSGGAVMTELFYAGGARRRAVLHSASDGQRMVALPCALAISRILDGRAQKRGALTAYDLLGAQELLDELVAAGYRLDVDR